MMREVVPEILDSLNPDDPRAIRSRRDLRHINRFMRGEHWIMEEVVKLQPRRVIELGSGEGSLANKIKGRLPNTEVVGLDLIPRPHTVDAEVRWHCGDVMDYAGYCEDSVVVANLFMHHLSESQLRSLGEAVAGVRGVFLAEPHRAITPQIMGRVIYPLINEVTRHDMIVSIKAGFAVGEIPEIITGFHWEESRGLFGGLRSKGIRK